MGAQEAKLRRGVDVVVGTPGRIKVYCYGLSLWILNRGVWFFVL